MNRAAPPLLALALLALACAVPGRAGAQTPAAAPPAPSATIAPAQAQQTLDILKDDKRRAALIATLETIAKAEPAPAAAKPALTVPLPPGSAGAEILVGLSAFFNDLSAQSRALFGGLQRLPELRRGFFEMADDPAKRAELLDAAWRLAAAAGCGLAAECLVWLALLRPARRLRLVTPAAERAAAAPPEIPPEAAGEPIEDGGEGEGEREEGGEEEREEAEEEGPVPAGPEVDEPPLRQHRIRTTAWTLLRRIPLALARLMLDLVPVLAFAVASHVVIGSPLGGPDVVRFVLLNLVNAYVLCRVLLSLVRMMLSPDSARLRLLLLRDDTARYLFRWLRRLVVVVVFGTALAAAGLVLGISQEAHDAVLKAVSLAVHAMLIVMVLQKRSAVAKRLRARKAASGPFAALSNGLAASWHVIAIVLLAGTWLVWAVELPNGLPRLLHFVAVTAAILIVSRLVLIVVLGTLERSARERFDAAAPRSAVAARLRAYAPLAHAVVTGLVYVVALLALLQAWDFGVLSWLATASGHLLLSSAASIAVTLVLALIAWEAANTAIERRLDRLSSDQQAARSARLRTLLPLMRTTLLVVLLTVVALMVLSDLGINIAPLLAGAGVVGIAIGFGSQKLVQDVITGLFLLLENAVQVGDVVTLASLTGVVEHLSIRSIRLRAEDGSVHVVPFSAVTTVTNMTRDFAYAVIQASVSYNDDYDEVVTVLRDIVREMREEPRWASEILDDIEVMGLDRFADSSVIIKARIRCGPFGRWGVLRDFQRRMKQRFEEHGIEIPYPHQQLVVAPDVGHVSGAAQPEWHK